MTPKEETTKNFSLDFWIILTHIFVCEKSTFPPPNTYGIRHLIKGEKAIQNEYSA